MIAPGTPPHLQKRIGLFYLLGVFNVFLGLYVLVEEVPSVSRSKALWMAAFFLVFAAVNFWFPRAILRKWRADQERLQAGSTDAGASDGSGKPTGG